MIDEQNANDGVQPVRLSVEGAMMCGPVDAFFRLDRWRWWWVGEYREFTLSAGIRDPCDKFMNLFPVIGRKR